MAVRDLPGNNTSLIDVCGPCSTVYGRGQVFDADRLIDVLEAFESFRQTSRMSQGMGTGNALPAAADNVLSAAADADAEVGVTAGAVGEGGNGGGGGEEEEQRLLGGVAPEPGSAAGAGAGPEGPSGWPDPFGVEALFRASFPSVHIPPPPPIVALFLPPPPAADAAYAAGPEDVQAREALTFVLSPEGGFFREFLMDEAVKGIDALSRDNAARVLLQLAGPGR
jgi:aarF domain-containing kinase